MVYGLLLKKGSDILGTETFNRGSEVNRDNKVVDKSRKRALLGTPLSKIYQKASNLRSATKEKAISLSNLILSDGKSVLENIVNNTFVESFRKVKEAYQHHLTYNIHSTTLKKHVRKFKEWKVAVPIGIALFATITGSFYLRWTVTEKNRSYTSNKAHHVQSRVFNYEKENFGGQQQKRFPQEPYNASSKNIDDIADETNNASKKSHPNQPLKVYTSFDNHALYISDFNGKWRSEVLRTGNEFRKLGRTWLNAWSGKTIDRKKYLNIHFPALSPDERYIAFADIDLGLQDIYIVDIKGTTLLKVHSFKPPLKYVIKSIEWLDNDTIQVRRGGIFDKIETSEKVIIDINDI